MDWSPLRTALLVAFREEARDHEALGAAWSSWVGGVMFAGHADKPSPVPYSRKRQQWRALSQHPHRTARRHDGRQLLRSRMYRCTKHGVLVASHGPDLKVGWAQALCKQLHGAPAFLCAPPEQADASPSNLPCSTPAFGIWHCAMLHQTSRSKGRPEHFFWPLVCVGPVVGLPLVDLCAEQCREVSLPTGVLTLLCKWLCEAW